MMGNHKKNEKPCSRRIGCSSEYTWLGKRNNGFTLAELLIVVAIIAVFVAIAIPIFTSQLEKSREATDLANVRAAYAEVMTAAIVEDYSAVYSGAQIYQADGTYQAVVEPLKQKKDGWQMDEAKLNIGGAASDETAHWHGKPKANGKCTVKFDGESVHFYWDDGSGSGEGSGSGNGSGSGGAGGSSVDAIISNAIPFPSKVDGGKVIQGNVYSFNGKTYVALTTITFNEYYYPTPEDSSWGYRELSSDATVLTKNDIKNGQLTSLNAGMIFQYADGRTFIRTYDATHGQEPDKDLGNWQIINP